MNAGLPGPPLRALGRRRPSDRDGTNLVQGLPQSLIPSFPLHQVFGPFPTAPSPLGADPIGKHFLPASFPEVLPIPNPEALPSSSPQSERMCLAEKHLLFSGAHPSHFHKNKRKRRPRRRFLHLPLFEENPRKAPYFSFSSDFFSFNGLIFTLPPLLEEAQPIQVLPGFRETIFFSGSESSSSLSESFFSTRVNSSS